MCVVPIDDYSNLTRLGILDVDPGAVLGQPSPNAFKPLPYLPLHEPLQKPDFSAVSGFTQNDTFVRQKKNKKAINKSGEETNSLPQKKERKKFNWAKAVGIASFWALVLLGLPKLIKNFPGCIKKIPQTLKKIPQALKKVPQALKNLFKKTP